MLEFPVTVQGKVYHSYREMATGNCSYMNLIKRLERGMSPEEAMFGKQEFIMCQDKEFRSYEQVASFLDVTSATVYSRLKAKGTKGLSSKPKEREFHGVYYTSKRELAERFGVKYETFRKRESANMPTEACLLYNKKEYDKMLKTKGITEQEFIANFSIDMLEDMYSDL